MKRLRSDLRYDYGGKDTDENNAGNDIAQIQRHRHGIAAGLAKRRRKDFDPPKGQSGFGDLARTDFVRPTRVAGLVSRPLLGWVLLGD
jgi:hypothetical protein